MKRIQNLFMVLVLVLVIGGSAYASSFEATASYLMQVGETSLESGGVLVNGAIELYPNLLANGSFLLTNPFASQAGSEEKNRLVTIGGLYRVISDPDLQVLAGVGFADYLGANDLRGEGIYGNIGFKFLFNPRLTWLVELNYVPKFKIEDNDHTLLDARATVGFQFLHDLGLQGTIKHYRISGNEEVTNTLIGGGVIISF